MYIYTYIHILYNIWPPSRELSPRTAAAGCTWGDSEDTDYNDVYIYIYIYMYICMYVCMYVCMYIYIYIYICTHVCINMYIYICICI